MTLKKKPEVQIRFRCGCLYGLDDLPTSINRKIGPKHKERPFYWKLTCVRCGKIVITHRSPGARLRCDPCAKLAHKEKIKKYHNTHSSIRREPTRWHRVDPEKLTAFINTIHTGPESPCKGCEREKMDKNECPECPRLLSAQSLFDHKGVTGGYECHLKL